MMSKYYQPEIEEFHFGFEFEVGIEEDVDIAYVKSDINKWVKSIFKPNYGSDIDIARYRITRVKYLDQEDIEDILKRPQLKGDDVELNFQYIAEDNSFYEFDYDTEYKELTVEIFKPNGDGTHNCYTLFKGVIKNKSEFKKLLKQLKIKTDE